MKKLNIIIVLLAVIAIILYKKGQKAKPGINQINEKSPSYAVKIPSSTKKATAKEMRDFRNSIKRDPRKLSVYSPIARSQGKPIDKVLNELILN